MEKPTIKTIKLFHVVDEIPDTSCIGEYTDTWSEWAICRCCGEYLENCDDEHTCPTKGREYLFFKPYAGGEKEGTEDYQKYGKQDYDRMEGLNRGDWCFIGIYAVAEVSYQTGSSGERRIETLQSGGLWGIESDSGDYLEEVDKEELTSLREHLEQFNVDLSNWDELTEDVEQLNA